MSVAQTSRTLVGRLVALGIGLIMALAICEILLRIAFPHWREFYSGWFMTLVNVPGHPPLVVGTPGFDGYFAQNNGDFRTRIRINENGLRNDEPIEAANGRLWAIGDSMTFGWGVERNQNFTAIIGERARVPTYNVAAPGADVCGYETLAARMPESVKPSMVVVGLILENDLAAYDCERAADRSKAEMNSAADTSLSLMEVKRKLTEVSAFYNFMAVALKRVNLVQEVMIRLHLINEAHQDHAAAPEAGRSAVIDGTVTELARLRSMFAGVPFAVLIAPARFEIRDGDPAYAQVRHDLVAQLSTRGIDTIDPFEEFQRVGLDATHFKHDGHWNAEGHKIAGEAVAVWAESHHSSPPAQ